MAQMKPVGSRDVLIAVATFLVVAAVLVPVLVAPRFAASVPRERTVTRATAANAAFLDRATGRVVEGVRLDRRRVVDPVASPVTEADSYTVSTSTSTASGRIVSRQRWTGVQRRSSGVTITSPFNTEQVTTFDSNGDGVERRRPVRSMGGLLLRFPRDTKRRSYVRWDPETGTGGRAEFVRATRLSGSTVLEFRQRSETPAVNNSGVISSGDITLWVRPETGSVVRTSTRVITRLAVDQRVVLDATFVDDPRDVRAASARVDDLQRAHTWSSIVGPGVSLALGMIAFMVAVRIGRAQRSNHRSRRVRSAEVS